METKKLNDKIIRELQECVMLGMKMGRAESDEEKCEALQKMSNKYVDIFNAMSVHLASCLNPIPVLLEPFWAYVLKNYSETLIEGMNDGCKAGLRTIEALLGNNESVTYKMPEREKGDE